MRFLIASTALLTAGAAVAAPASSVHTVRDGAQLFHYTATKSADGSVMLAGEEAHSGAPFAFTVRGSRVDGTMNGQTIAFSVPRKTALAVREQVGN